MIARITNSLKIFLSANIGKNIMKPTGNIEEDVAKINYPCFPRVDDLDLRRKSFREEKEAELKIAIQKKLEETPNKSKIQIAKELETYPYKVCKLIADMEYSQRRADDATLESKVKSSLEKNVTGFSYGRECFKFESNSVGHETGAPREQIRKLVPHVSNALFHKYEQIVFENIIDFYDIEKNDFKVREFTKKFGMFESLFRHITSRNGLLHEMVHIADISRELNANYKDVGAVYLVIINPNNTRNSAVDMIKVSQHIKSKYPHISQGLIDKVYLRLPK